MQLLHIYMENVISSERKQHLFALGTKIGL